MQIEVDVWGMSKGQIISFKYGSDIFVKVSSEQQNDIIKSESNYKVPLPIIQQPPIISLKEGAPQELNMENLVLMIAYHFGTGWFTVDELYKLYGVSGKMAKGSLIYNILQKLVTQTSITYRKASTLSSRGKPRNEYKLIDNKKVIDRESYGRK